MRRLWGSTERWTPEGAMAFPGRALDWSRPYLMGVVNVTPDSFSDGGRFASPLAAIAHGHRLIAEGADVIDVGGESTRPGAQPVAQGEELERVVPVLRGLAETQAILSVDTTKAEVARAAIGAGAGIVNDVAGGLFDPDMFAVLADSGAAYVCGHVRGKDLEEVHRQKTSPRFEDIVHELGERLARMPGNLRARTIVDPCLGFGKDAQTNFELCRRSGDLARALECPVLIGPSRKRFVGELTGGQAEGRDAATAGVCLAAICAGAHLVRVHDVELTAQVLRAFQAVAAA